MADQFDNNKDNDQEQKYEKFCFFMSQTGESGREDDRPS